MDDARLAEMKSAVDRSAAEHREAKALAGFVESIAAVLRAREQRLQAAYRDALDAWHAAGVAAARES